MTLFDPKPQHMTLESEIQTAICFCGHSLLQHKNIEVGGDGYVLCWGSKNTGVSKEGNMIFTMCHCRTRIILEEADAIELLESSHS